jgi:GNAT superfamily N-acetyltransferase
MRDVYASYRGEWNDMNIKHDNYTFTVYQNDEEIKVGQAEVYVTNGMITKLKTAFDVDGDMFNAYFQVIIEDESPFSQEDCKGITASIDLIQTSNIAYIRSFSINHEYRGQGLGKESFQRLLHDLCRDNIQTVLLHPLPMDNDLTDEQYETNRQRLTNLYASFGFTKTIGILEPEDYAMIRQF